MRIQIRRAAKALDQGDGAAGRRFTFEVGLFDQVRVDRAVQDAQRYRERQHPLAHRHTRQDVVDQIRRRLQGVTVQAAGYQLQPNAERHLRSRLRLAQTYPQELLDETLRIAERKHIVTSRRI